MHIKREKVDTKQMEYRYNDALKNYQDSINEIEQKPRLVNSLMTEAYELFFTACLFEKDHQKTAEYLLHFAESALAVFQMALHVGDTISFEVAGKKMSITAEDKSYDISVLKWIHLFYAGAVLQNNVLLKKATALNLDEINGKASSSSEAYNLLYAKFLQKWYLKNGDVSNDLLEASKATDNVSKSSALYDYMLDIGSPQIDIFSSILYKDKKELDDNFEKAIQYHKTYFEGASSKGIDDFVGIVSLPLSGLYAIAKKEGLQPDVTSDFISEI